MRTRIVSGVLALLPFCSPVQAIKGGVKRAESGSRVEQDRRVRPRLGGSVSAGERQNFMGLRVSSWDCDTISRLEHVMEILKNRTPVTEAIDINAVCGVKRRTALMYAAAKEDTEVVKQLLESDDLKPDAQDEDGWTALMFAVDSGNVSIVEALLKRGARVDIFNKNNKTAMDIAIAHNSMPIVDALVKQYQTDKGLLDDFETAISSAIRGESSVAVGLLRNEEFDVNHRYSLDNKTALMLISTRTLSPDILKALLERDDVEVNDRDINGKTALIWAVQRGRKDIVSALVNDSRTDVNAADQHGATPLMYASASGKLDIIELLLQRQDICVNATEAAGKTALMIAIRNCREDVACRLLADPRTDPCRGDAQQKSALIWVASTDKMLKVVKDLLKDPEIDVNAADPEKRTALMWAARYGNGDVVRELLKSPQIDVDAKDKDGRTALMWAAKYKEFDIIKQLLDCGANLYEKDDHNKSALDMAYEVGDRSFMRSLLKKYIQDHDDIDNENDLLLLATACGEPSMVSFLLEDDEFRCDPNAMFSDGATALICAACNGYLEVVNAILGKGNLDEERVDINRRDDYGTTALMYACERGHVDIVEELLSYPDIDFNIQDGRGMTALMYAVDGGHSEIVGMLLRESDIDIDAVDNEGKTALIHSVCYLRDDLVEKLVYSGANLDVKDCYGKTAYMYAEESQDTEVINALLMSVGTMRLKYL